MPWWPGGRQEASTFEIRSEVKWQTPWQTRSGWESGQASRATLRCLVSSSRAPGNAWDSRREGGPGMEGHPASRIRRRTWWAWPRDAN